MSEKGEVLSNWWDDVLTRIGMSGVGKLDYADSHQAKILLYSKPSEYEEVALIVVKRKGEIYLDIRFCLHPENFLFILPIISIYDDDLAKVLGKYSRSANYSDPRSLPHLDLSFPVGREKKFWILWKPQSRDNDLRGSMPSFSEEQLKEVLPHIALWAL